MLRQWQHVNSIKDWQHEIIPRALEHSGYKMKSKGLMAMLSNGTLFKKDEQFNHLEPIYDVSSEDIETYIKSLLAQE